MLRKTIDHGRDDTLLFIRHNVIDIYIFFKNFKTIVEDLML